MPDEKYFNKIASIVLIAVLVILAFLIIQPILLSSIFGLILAFIFYPIYKKFFLWTKSKNLSAFAVCILLLAIIIIPLIFFVPVIINQAFSIYTYLQGTDFSVTINRIVSYFFPSQDLSKSLIVAINSFTAKMTSSFISKFTEILLSSPAILIQFLVILFLFFFGLRDGEKFVEYLKSLSPLSKESEKKVFQQFKDITHSVIYGNIIVGIIHGLAAGAALFVLGIPNALVLTLLAIFFSIIPILGPWLVWVPVDVYLFASGRTTAAVGLLIYGLVFVSWIDNLIRPLIVSRRTKINSGIILISMVGGLYVFGILGLVLGPLIIAYLILLFEFFKNKKTESILMQKVE